MRRFLTRLIERLRARLPAPPLPLDSEAIQLLGRARVEAIEGGAGYIGVEHLLAAMLAQPRSLAGVVLARVDVEARARIDRLSPAVQAQLPRGVTAPLLGIAAHLAQLRPGASPGSRQPPPETLPFTRRAETALRLAEDEARALGHDRVTSAHVLLGLVLEGGGLAAHILQEAGVSHAAVCAALRDLHAARSEP